jgi:two-component system invasion response regulator UvrY
MANPIRLAIVDDHLIFSSGLTQVLKMISGFELQYHASTISELLLQIQDGGSVPDICLLGLNLPNMHDHRFLDELKKPHPGMKVLVMSVYTHEFNIIRMMQKGANGYLSKSCTEKELQRALLSVHYSGAYHDSLPAGVYQAWMEQRQPFISPREAQFLSLLCSDISYEEIAGNMGMELSTIEGYRDILFQKLNVNSRIGLIISAYIMGVNKLVQNN